MCYMTIISTTSERDLKEFNSVGVIFTKDMPGLPEERILKHQNKWFIESIHGCSCGFRHLMSCNFPDLGFSEPEEWFPEEQEDIEATLKLVNAFKQIISDGSKLDCIDAWAGNENIAPNISGQVEVNFRQLPDSEFRFIENYQHEFTNET